MSKEIICRECHTPNKPGSKFCNNCGHRLPPTTSLICPNCETPNPRDRLYCDECGAKLIPDTQSAPLEQPEEEQPPDKGKFFSLPARPPGDTGELDPSKIPDWLRGEAEQTEDPDVESELPHQTMPKIEEVGSPKKMTDDLPDWLVDEHDSKPIIGSPRIITTEHYLNLIQEPGDKTEDDLSETAAQADLPDWLADLAEPSSDDQVTMSDDQSTADDALTEWLASISPEAADEDEKSDDEQLAAAEMPETDAPDLDDLALGKLADETDETAVLEDEMLDWLAETLPETGQLSKPPDDTPAESAAPEPEIEDWLADLAVSDADEAAEAAEPFTANDASEDDFASWFDEEPTDDAILADLADVVAQQNIGETDETVPDWVTGMLTTNEGDTAVSPPDAADEKSQTQPDWMAEFAAEAPLEPPESTEDIAEEPEQEDSQPAITPPEEASIPAAISDDAPLEKGETASLPDWLADLSDTAEPSTEQSADETLFTGLFAPDEAADFDLDWFTADEQDDEPASSAATEASFDPASPPAEDEPDTLPDSSPLNFETSWLSELANLDDDAFVADEPAEAEDDAPPEKTEAVQYDSDFFAAEWPEEESAEETEPAKDAAAVEDETIDEPEERGSDWMAADTMLSDALEEELPDWLDELGPPAADETPPDIDEVVAPSDNLPDWLVQMKPDSVHSGSGGISSSLGLPDVSDPLPDLAEELDGANLPDWLEDIDAPGAMGTAVAAEQAASALPDWLHPDGDEEPGDSGLLNLGSQPPPDNSDDWTAVLQDLPPSTPIQDRMAQADIPDWIQALKPSELTGEAPVEEEEKQLQEIGPLAGIRDVIDIEPLITKSHEAGGLPAFTVTKEQQAQATLLKQLALSAPVTEPVVSDAGTAIGLRLALAALLLAATLAGLLLPNLLPRAQTPAPPYVTQAHTAVTEAAGQPVLVAVEYTPALAGELDAAAIMLLEQLAANGSQIVTVSQYAGGTAVARNLAGDSPSLGLLLGDSMGLRQLGGCLEHSAACSTLSNRGLTPDMQQTLADVGLIIVLTGERDSLINWIEQVGRVSEAPMIAGVTQSLGPVAAPYLDSEQLQGLLVGLPDTAVYQQTFIAPPTATVTRQLSAQTMGQLLAALLLLIGGLGYGIMGFAKREKKSQA